MENEVTRLKNDFGVDRWEAPYLDRPAPQVHNTSRAMQRQLDARRFLSSSVYGAHQSNQILKSHNLMPPPVDPDNPPLAPFHKPNLGITATRSLDDKGWASITNPETIKVEVSADEKLRLYSPLPTSGRMRPTNSGIIPHYVRRQLDMSSYQPSWSTTASQLSMEKGLVDSALPKNAKRDLGFHIAKHTGIFPKTGRYPLLHPEACYRANELEASLTTHWSHSLRGQKY